MYVSVLVHLLLLALFASSQNTVPPPHYTCTDLIFLSCGSPATSRITFKGRNWVSDNGSEFLSGNQSFSSEPSDKHHSVSQIPYFSYARIFLSAFTYSFNVSAGPKFLRLHFYPEKYSGAGADDISTSYFSVVANGYTLLSNFSAFLALTPDDTYFSKEFVVNSGDGDGGGIVELTFTPNDNSFAFVNAIEVVSMPVKLYYNRDYKNVSSVNVVNVDPFNLSTTTSLETVYRLNVGGAHVEPDDDSCMLRTWLTDQDFVSESPIPGIVVQPPENSSIEYVVVDTPPYMAPEVVYMYSRIMGGGNMRYNLTWTFPVDSGFNYLVRLHFCEMEQNITGKGQRLFVIYLDGNTAEKQADVLEMSGNAHGVPVHRDYVVLMSAVGPRTVLSLSMHPYTDSSFMPRFNNTTLSGIEIFKISGSGRSLAGLNPDPKKQPTEDPGSPSGQRSSLVPILAGVSGAVVAGIVFFSVVCFLIFRRKGRERNTIPWDPFSTTKSTKSRGSSLPSDLCRHFSIAEIREATNDFDPGFIIGAGGFGNVYKGSIDGGTTHVAIKRLNPGSRQGAHEFLTEIEMLSRLRHVHLVSLIGFSEDDHEMILVYDYMSRGTLRAHLTQTQNPPLGLIQRLQICIGAARGLQYLHTGAKHPIIHRDVKTTNILLDDKFVAKVSDFGLSRTVANGHVTTVVKGSFGYLDPEYIKRQQLTEKSDVYSFGVVLCEVITAKAPSNLTAGKRRVCLAEWARECHRRGAFGSLVDEKLKGKIAAESLAKYGEIVMGCLAENGGERPSMNDVVWGLEFVLELQRTADKEMGVEEVESDGLWDESLTASTEVTTVAGSSGSGEKLSKE